MLDLVPLALGSALYPALLAIVLLILGRPDPGRLLFAYLCGGMLFSLTAGFGLLSVLRDGGVVGGSDHTVNPPSTFCSACSLCFYSGRSSPTATAVSEAGSGADVRLARLTHATH